MWTREKEPQKRSSRRSSAFKRRFAVGDIHGCFKTLKFMVEEELQLTAGDSLYLVGDYIDRGWGSKQVLDYLMLLPERSIEVYPVMGNHEYMLLRSFESSEDFGLWHRNGCAATLLSFGIGVERINDPDCLHQVPDRYIRFIEGMKYYHETDDYFFVHAGLGDFEKDPEEDVISLLWTRREVYDTGLLHGRNLVHGHTPVPLETIRQRTRDPGTKIVNLDAGCVYKNYPGFGNLAAMDLDTREIRHLRSLD